MRLTILSNRFRNFIKKTIFLVFIVFCITIIFFVFYFLLSVKNITVNATDECSPIRGLNSYFLKNFFLVNPDEVKKTIIRENPRVFNVMVTKKFPDSLIIMIECHTDIAVFEMNGGYAYLSETGRIIQKSKEKKDNLPLIKYYQKINYTFYQSGDKLEYNDILTALYFVKTVRSMGIYIDTIDIKGFDMLVFNIGRDGKQLFFTTEKRKENQEYEFRQIIRQFKIEGRDYKSIDFRFDKPVIRF